MHYAFEGVYKKPTRPSMLQAVLSHWHSWKSQMCSMAQHHVRGPALNPQPSALNPKKQPSTLNPTSTLNHQKATLTPQPNPRKTWNVTFWQESCLIWQQHSSLAYMFTDTLPHLLSLKTLGEHTNGHAKRNAATHSYMHAHSSATTTTHCCRRVRRTS